MAELDWQTGVGLAAGFLTTTAFIPQVIRTWRTRSAEDISLGTFVLFVLGVALWLIYGLVRSDIAMIAANAATLVLASAILVFKLRYG